MNFPSEQIAADQTVSERREKLDAHDFSMS
jgi:hypothetical protein